MNLTDKQIAEVAGLLDCGMSCFYHLPTGTIEAHPDIENPYFDPEPWQELTDKIEKNWDEYESIEKMDKKAEFQLIEGFAFSVSIGEFRDKILEKISGRRPFQNFKLLIDSSPYRQDWFDFKMRSYIDHVKRQLLRS